MHGSACLLTILALSGSVVARAQEREISPAPARWTADELSADLDQIAAAVRSDWSYLDDRRENSGVDVDALLGAAKAALPTVHDADDFARVLRRFGAGLQDGHAWTSVPGESRRPARRLPFLLADCAEGLVVVAVADGLGAPRRGDVLTALQGTPIEDVIAEAEREECASTPGMRRQLAIEALHRTRAAQVRCSFVASDVASDVADDVAGRDAVGANGAALEGEGERAEKGVRAAAREVDVSTLPPGAEAPAPRDLSENWSLTWPRADVALLHLHSFQVPRWSEWLKAKPEERDALLAEGRARIDAIIAELLEHEARTLIVDVRGNGGGTDLLGIHLAERLLGGRFVYFQLTAKHLDIWMPPGGTTYGAGSHARFSGQVIALVDEGSFSTTDNFLRCLDDLHPSFAVVGRPTGGGTGAPRELVVAAHSGATLGACTQRVYGPKGALTEGRGTEPDVRVRWTRADWLTGRDPDLQAALQWVDEAADR